SDLVKKLRRLIVDEWILNADTYNLFLLNGTDIEKEASLFLQDGFFDGALGDAMPLAAANILGIFITIVTDHESNPLLIVQPPPSKVLTTETVIHMSLRQLEKVAHYDALIPYTNRI
ncbi:unnamed protein product, partial [Owenia fusiformis]